MPSLLDNIIGNNVNIKDEVIASNMLASGKSAANAYLNAALISSTPELRAIYSSSLTQIIGGHSALTELVVNRGWAKPYDTPAEQLSDTYSKSKDVIESK
ncbi:spore coat protein [Clostridium sp. DJ247]|uniref:spore coat protein n=1 Tax=Clostridium sp. DJ247 TaxID=2726188 RepID=UPI00162702C5|nr:spore coat protein [Clostridium sp. DJ247]MBC2581492.1 spore coat protein [Clostridium sp. DJ247]